VGDTYNDTPENLRVFYCWQGDLPKSTNSTFIKTAIKDAIEEIKEETEKEKLNKVNGCHFAYPIEYMDSSINICGSQVWPLRIFENISDSDVFIADLSFVSCYRTHDGRHKSISNANVMLEIGMAFGTIGRERVIGVFNEAYGKLDNLPTDFSGTEYPVRYFLKANASSESELEQKKQLIKSIKWNIHQALENTLKKAKKVADRLNQFELSTLLNVFSIKECGGIENDDADRAKIRDAIKRAIQIEREEFKNGDEISPDAIEELRYMVLDGLISKGVLWTRHQWDNGDYAYSYRLTSIGKLVLKIIHKGDHQKSN